MKSAFTFCVILFFVIISSLCYAQNILQTRVNSTQIDHIVEHIDTWRNQKREEWHAKLNELSEDDKYKLIKRAEEATSYEWPSLFASKYLEYKQTGNRTNYERDQSRRRSIFSQLIIGELVEGKGRFMPHIVDGLWLIMEESTWVSAAHIVVQKKGIGLADPDDVVIDLGAGVTACDLAIVYFLLKDQLNQVSEIIPVKLKKELQERILIPYLDKDFWWMGFGKGIVNNWNIWINTNVLKTLLLIEDDPNVLKHVMEKIIRSADEFINFYPEDGACEEGPSYWGHAGGELGQMIFWLHDASFGQVKFDDISKIHNIGRYILYSHIGDNKFVNFADASATQIPSPSKVWTFGDIYGDDNMKGFASFLHQKNNSSISSNSIHNFFMLLTYYDEISTRGTSFHREQAHFYESLQMVTIRSNHPEGDLFFAAIGSNNGVSHNHNDVGSFMLYYNTIPILIDVGVGTYTKTTFSAQRYSLWNVQSQWHNLPIINGVEQSSGSAYKAKDVKFTKGNNSFSYQLDISDAYPKSAKINSWIRNFNFNTEKNSISVRESMDMSESIAPNEVVFVTPLKPVVSKSMIDLLLPSGHTARISYKMKEAEASVEELKIDDDRISKLWGEKLYRVKLKVKGNKKKQQFEYIINMINK